MNILEHVVTSVDSVQSLAATYLGDASRWRDIVDFNNLDYPYISTDLTFQTSAYASGTVTVSRIYNGSPLTVPKGTIFAVPVVEGFPSRLYVSVEAITIPSGVSLAAIPVQCTLPGIWGNVPQASISTIITTDPTLTSAFSLIANVNPFANGNTYNVRLLGDSILIPLDGSWDGTTTYDDLDTFYEEQFGTDLTLGDDGDLVFDGYGSIGSVSGLANLGQAARDMLMTPKNSLVYHPTYGSYVDQLVGQQSAPYIQKMISLSIIETLGQDDRIARVNVVSLTQSGTTCNVVIDIYPVQQGNSIRVPVSLPNLHLLGV